MTKVFIFLIFQTKNAFFLQILFHKSETEALGVVVFSLKSAGFPVVFFADTGYKIIIMVRLR